MEFTIVYKDDTDDYVQVDDQDDLLSAYDWAKDMHQKELRFIISTQSKEEKVQAPKQNKAQVDDQ